MPQQTASSHERRCSTLSAPPVRKMIPCSVNDTFAMPKFVSDMNFAANSHMNDSTETMIASPRSPSSAGMNMPRIATMMPSGSSMSPA